jgi:hypothetical protein
MALAAQAQLLQLQQQQVHGWSIFPALLEKQPQESIAYSCRLISMIL